MNDLFSNKFEKHIHLMKCSIIQLFSSATHQFKGILYHCETDKYIYLVPFFANLFYFCIFIFETPIWIPKSIKFPHSRTNMNLRHTQV